MVLFLTGSIAEGAESIFASLAGDELVVELDRLDVLRQTHSGLSAVLKLRGSAGEKQVTVNLEDAAVDRALVVDLAGFGRCDALTVTVRDGRGTLISERVISPIPSIDIKSTFTAAKPGAEKYAYIEPGKAMRQSGGAAASTPRILLPDADHLRRVELTQPSRQVLKSTITYPVMAAADYPLVGGVVVGRQTAAPKDTTKASLYFSYKKGIYDGPTLSRWQKFLVEIPILPEWGEGTGDQDVALRVNQFAVHLTNEAAPGGKNMLGAAEGDLGQKGELDSDDQGRIYWRVEGGGAFVVRFDPLTRRFEQPPVRVDFQKLVPDGAGLLNDNLCKVTCTRGRVFFTMCNDTLASGDPGNPQRRRLGGVFSISQDWRDPAAFERDIRLHVGSWETASPTFYKMPPKPDADVRKLGGCQVTEAGLFITTAGPKYEGGPWRLDLDARGNTMFFGQVSSLDAKTSADGRAVQPTTLVKVKGVQKGRELNPGPGGGLDLITFGTGEITIPRASVRLLLRGFDGLEIQRAAKHGPPTYDGAPTGTVTVQYDVIAKLKSSPDTRGPLAESVKGGPSLGPAFLVTPIPGVPDKAIAVCEYTGYPLSILDFSRVQAMRAVAKRFLPATSPEKVGLGPYNSIWLKHGNDPWLYVTGYTGMARVQYSQDGKPLEAAIRSDVFNGRVAGTPVDGHPRTSMKKVDGLIPAFGGRLIDSGYGISGRGGDALSTGIELFNPDPAGDGSKPIQSQTAAYLSRCFALRTLRGRLVWKPGGAVPHQEVFAASGSVRKQFVNELSEQSKALAPGNLDAKIFCYEVTENAALRDLFGFSLPPSPDDRSVEGHIVLSPCNRYLVILTQDGVLYSYAIATKQFVDGLVLAAPAKAPLRLLEFHRPSEIIFRSPDGQIFFVDARGDSRGGVVNFHRVAIDPAGKLRIQPHLSIGCDEPNGHEDFDRIVRCFMPDLRKKDGSYDLILGYSQSTAAPRVRLIPDFIQPRRL